LKPRRVTREVLKDHSDEERGYEKSYPETRTGRKNMPDALKNARINDYRSEMRKVEGILQRSTFEKSLRADGQSGRENLQTNPPVEVVRLPKEIRIAELN